MSELIQRNVVVIPIFKGDSWNMIEASHRWSWGLSETFRTEFSLGHSDTSSHVSIYQAAYPPAALPHIKDSLQRIASATAMFPLVSVDCGIFWKNFIFWDMQKTAPLVKLHQACLNELNHLREGKLTPIQQEFLADRAAAAQYAEKIRQYGHPLCATEMRPHITLTRLKKARDAEPAIAWLRGQQTEKYRLRGMRAFVDRLFLTEVGPHGTCPKVLASFPFRT